MLRRGSWYQSVGSPLTAEISPLLYTPFKAKVTVRLTHILDLNYFLEDFYYYLVRSFLTRRRSICILTGVLIYFVVGNIQDI